MFCSPTWQCHCAQTWRKLCSDGWSGCDSLVRLTFLQRMLKHRLFSRWQVSGAVFLRTLNGCSSNRSENCSDAPSPGQGSAPLLLPSCRRHAFILYLKCCWCGELQWNNYESLNLSHKCGIVFRLFIKKVIKTACNWFENYVGLVSCLGCAVWKGQEYAAPVLQMLSFLPHVEGEHQTDYRHTSQHHSWPSLRTRSVWAYVDIWSYLNTCRRHCNSAWYDHPAVPFLPINNEDNYCTWDMTLILNRTPRILPHSWFFSGDKITRALVDAKLGCIYSPIYTAVSGRSKRSWERSMSFRKPSSSYNSNSTFLSRGRQNRGRL